MSRTEVASRAAIGDERSLGRRLDASLGREGLVSVSAFDRVVAAVDASHYLLTPKAVVTPDGIEAMGRIFAAASAAGESVTFRSGGTSLSGQASTGAILIDTRSAFRAITVLDDGARVRVGPGVTVRKVNAHLARRGRKLGPDPASEIACTIGGVVANNSSGMACGTAQNAYRTLESAIVVLPSGTVVDTGAPDADERLRRDEPALWQTLQHLSDRVRHDAASRTEIERQFRIKNTMGYGVNALVDFSTPIDMLLHLMVGSEGTLGFVAEATFRTVPLLRHAATALLVFDTLRAATDALVDIVASGAATIELMDAASLRAARVDPASSAALPAMDIVHHCALLVEYQSEDAAGLERLEAQAEVLLAAMATTTPAVLSRDAATRAALWHVRKGLYATVAGARPSGTTALLEDVAVPVERLSETCAGLTRLFAEHGYDDAVIFGHAKDGNVHFLITEDFEAPGNLERYRRFTEEMVDLVLAAGGTLKAEHGTGRIMAPFVERQYGPELYAVMLAIKQAFDPAGILNPDTIVSADPDIHLRHLKSTPTVEREVDRCVECGYCEPVCPSKDLTTTPRQRIVVRRAIAEARRTGDASLVRELEDAESYESVETCAVDGMCQTACPVLINTGDLVRRLRSESASGIERTGWNAAGKAWGPLTRVASTVMSVAAVVPAPVVELPNRAARRLLGEDAVPLWSPDLPRGGARRTEEGDDASSADLVVFEACVGTMFGPEGDGQGVAAAFASLARKAGLSLVRPAGIASLCCGTPWKSKGVTDGFAAMADATVEALWTASRQGALPVVCDSSSCSEGLLHAVEHVIATRPDRSALRIVDAVDATVERILPRLDVRRELASIMVHPTCSSTRAGSNANLLALAAAVATEVVVPDDWGCCAFAGDRGMLHPELTRSATRAEADEATRRAHDAYVSSNRTCEIGMRRATGHPYRHVLEVLDRASVAAAP